MAISLRVPMALSLSSSSSSSSKPSPQSAPSLKRRSFRVNSAKIPLPPLNPNDPFVQKLAAAVAINNDPEHPDNILNRKEDYSMPFMPFSGPKRAPTPAYLRKRGTYAIPGRPPDLASMLFAEKIVYIGLPLVPAVTKLIIAELTYLQWEYPDDPIYVYINSTGCFREDGAQIASDHEGFAIYDSMMLMKNKIYTMNLGAAYGQACLLLAAGTKGKRFSLPYSQVRINQPRVPPSGLMQATDVYNSARELLRNRDISVELLAKHTGQTEETIFEIFKSGGAHMWPTEAVKFGIVDKIFFGEKDGKVITRDSDAKPFL